MQIYARRIKWKVRERKKLTFIFSVFGPKLRPITTFQNSEAYYYNASFFWGPITLLHFAVLLAGYNYYPHNQTDPEPDWSEQYGPERNDFALTDLGPLSEKLHGGFADSDQIGQTPK